MPDPNLPTEPRFVDADTLARILDVSAETVRRQWRARQLPGIKVGRKLRFDVAQVRAALEDADTVAHTPARSTARPNFDALTQPTTKG